ncbi:hypothetical protein C8R45DRAFT_941667 [Mycena sanguinolenta]|nr:hypothetical protein C8R45DRAFT_941667 [Mycena sanguinolenta]
MCRSLIAAPAGEEDPRTNDTSNTLEAISITFSPHCNNGTPHNYHLLRSGPSANSSSENHTRIMKSEQLNLSSAGPHCSSKLKFPQTQLLRLYPPEALMGPPLNLSSSWETENAPDERFSEWYRCKRINCVTHKDEGKNNHRFSETLPATVWYDQQWKGLRTRCHIPWRHVPPHIVTTCIADGDADESVVPMGINRGPCHRGENPSQILVSVRGVIARMVRDLSLVSSSSATGSPGSSSSNI